ncbi:hypothetical protein BYT27DRAFT_7172525 [Phlegmacium glaucopus]|nr:hypothetical protein BYT27DRAFT_7172525 [Phlegmacium glaucopus]
MVLPMVIVDDTDPNISYSGRWFTAQNTQDPDNYGIPFQSTLHGVNFDANLSFPFSGSSVVVFGTSITTNASTHFPTWECFIDNKTIGSKDSCEPARNYCIFCQNDQLQDGPHVLSVRVKVVNEQTFWFDQIQYIPSSNVSLDQSLLRIDSSDPTIQYSAAWQSGPDIVNYTQIAGSSLTYEFSGISLSWITFIKDTSSSSATYSIDGQTPITFLVPASVSGPRYNQILFQTAILSPGDHTLFVMHQSNDSRAPLALDYFVVAGDAAPPPPPPPPSDAPSSTPSSTSTNHTGAIVGGVLGGLLFLLIVFVFIRRCNNRRDLHPTSTLTQVREAETKPVYLRRQSASQFRDPRFLGHEDSGLHTPAAINQPGQGFVDSAPSF